ncbi:hypothetical protein ACTV1V_000881 [Cronobacter turicensis]|uniref:Uncharacterized protein n=2 Tax=Cronobacter turicensis TaxID=413502 RepID=A0A2T7B430_9ENTR|nr:hypothetical protein [Cronobacter turicensis]EKM0525530.1 hypothetical protein [Cronobacter turicensis]ELQ5999872.1 hypothetical protein [Cronobacter turicensis]ELQ6002221.1 hypothetical protein [Cronobacter turicensis]ELQ6129169.1 hypothetical protein [Cronobacter turicensis]ELQ6131551.1 hypothetical protein [Cronobacter turicensis]
MKLPLTLSNVFRAIVIREFQLNESKPTVFRFLFSVGAGLLSRLVEFLDIPPLIKMTLTPAVPAVNAAILNKFFWVSAGDSRELVNNFVFGN